MKKWIMYPKNKPKESGRYLCTCTDPVKTVEVLYYDSENDEWTDLARAEVFSRFEVMRKISDKKLGKEYYEMLTHDERCYRKDVTAYTKLPKPYGLKLS